MVSNVYLHFFRQNKLCFQTIPGIGWRNFENVALFANSAVFIMVSNVYLHFFCQNRLCFQQFQELANEILKILLCLQTLGCLLWFPKFIWVVQSGTGWYGVVWGSTGRHGVVRCGTGWYGVVRCGTDWYVMLWCVTERYTPHWVSSLSYMLMTVPLTNWIDLTSNGVSCPKV